MLRLHLLKLGLLAFHLAWLLVVLPGHTRGLISWTKSDSPQRQSVDSCCSVRKSSNPDKPSEPTDQQKRTCAVCAYALGLTPPPVHDFTPPALKLLDILPLARAIVLAEQAHRLTYYACGPPATHV